MMEKLCPGVFCHQINLDSDSINSGKIAAIPSETLKYGVVIELIRYATKTKTVASKVEEWVCSLQPGFLEMKRSTLKARIKNAFETHKKIERKKKVASYMSLSEFHNDVFLPSGKKQSVQNNLCEKPTTAETDLYISTESAPKSQEETAKKSPCDYETKGDPNSHEQKETAKKSPPLFNSETESAPVPHVQTVTANIDKSPSQCDFETESAQIPLVQTVTANKSPSQCDNETESAPIPHVQTVTANKSPSQCDNENGSAQKSHVQPETAISAKKRHYPCETKSSQAEAKQYNLLQHEIEKRQKALHKMKTLVKTERETLEHMKMVKGHFSIRNVTKRDETAAKTRKTLRDTQATVSKQRRQLEKMAQTNHELITTVQDLKRQMQKLQTKLEKLKDIDQKKTNAQKLTSYYRTTLKKIRESPHSKEEPGNVYKKTLMKSETEIENLRIENEMLKETLNEKTTRTKNEDGTFSNEIRLCVMELLD
ncbi:uncharacterized protein LOC123553803 [Mercenaria mercenaria]|uniref:uncharacterized protein LOC123553803 n=1 Tax=Mercenaria mercenaria TaxID=6596 RepID=UPI00234F5595|nr:uncharacterized protein LOC123553803 [Mercenaria mercenaria]